MKKSTEDNIIDAFHKGSERAFSYIYDLYKKRILFFVMQLLQDKDEAPDIVSKIFFKIWERRESFSTLSNIKAFLYISAKNACYDYLKSQKRKEIKEKDLGYYIESIAGFTDEENAEYWMYMSELAAELSKEVESLSPRASEIIKLYFFEGLSSKQISEKLNIALSTVMNAKSIALKELKTTFLKKRLLPM